MKRRAYLLGGLFLQGLVAGCSGPITDSVVDETATPSSGERDAGAADQPGEAASDDDQPAAQGGPTEGPVLDLHEVRESFSVADVEYEVRALYQADELGDAATVATAKGVYLLVVVRVLNERGDAIEFPGTDFRVRSPETWVYRDDRATRAADADDRIDVRVWADEALSPDEERIGVAVFDVQPTVEYDVWITPVGNRSQPEHFVPVGEPQKLDYLKGVVTG